MIYPPGTAGGRTHRPRESSRGINNNKTSNSDSRGSRGGRSNSKQKTQQHVIQWKQRNVQEGLVVVDESQLTKLIKRDPIEKFYQMDPEPFATGLFANVRRCRSRKNGEEFAAKFSSRERYGEDCSAEIYHEIALLSLCSPSPRIVKLHDVFETPAEIILVLEFAPGGDLQTVIDNNLIPYESDVLNYVKQLLEGLAYLHERKIAHLDIKPQNLVMMDDFPNGEVKICDFEISRIILEDTEIREILGTPDYVAPEILHYEPITLAADMWSLGVTTYVLLTGFSPFGGETDQETFCNISQCQLDFPIELFEDVSEEAQDFIRKLLVRDPKTRLTARECLRHPWFAKISSVTSNIPTAHDNKSTINKRSKLSDSSEKNLRKYLSKSREALFERIVQQQQNQKNSLRKNTLLSQYNKSRMCESQMSLVSKSREKTMTDNQLMMSPSFSRSREKLYGLRSLSKSHEVLDFCKAIREVAGQDQAGTGILKTLTRATTADLSMLPVVKQKQMLEHSCSSLDLDSLEFSSPKEQISLQQERQNKDSEKPANDIPKLKCNIILPDTSLKSPDLLKGVLKNTFEFSIANSANQQSKYNRIDSEVPAMNNNDKNYRNTAMKDPNNDKIVDKGSCDSSVECKNNADKIRDENTNTTQVETKCKDEDSSGDTDTGEDTSSQSDSGSECGDKKETKENEESDEEPRFSVAQLVSAFNKHEEVVTKTSLKATMAAAETDQKISPVPDSPIDKFPTGPNALRLFIPDIDIRTSQRHKKEKRRQTKQEKCAENKHEISNKEIEKTQVTVDTPTIFPNIDNVNNNKNKHCADNIITVFMSDPPRSEINSERKDIHTTSDTLTNRINNVHLTLNSTPNYRRSSSLSSDTSGSRTPNDGFSSMEMSWEETPSSLSPGEQQKMLPPRSQSKSPNTVRSGENSWGKVCMGSYTRAMKKFTEKANENPVENNELPRRKTSVHSSPSSEEINVERIRKKSAPAMK